MLFVKTSTALKFLIVKSNNSLREQTKHYRQKLNFHTSSITYNQGLRENTEFFILIHLESHDDKASVILMRQWPIVVLNV